MNHDTVKIALLKGEHPRDGRKAGDAKFSIDSEKEGHLYVVLPGSDDVHCIPVTRDRNKADKNARLWYLTGPLSAPTLHPSIDAKGQWHGWLKNGTLESC
jgi:hypothetical protein